MKIFAPTNPKVNDLTGRRFGRLLVLGQTDRPAGYCDTEAFWACRCECGESVAVSKRALLRGHTVSCGCHNTEQHTTHGMRQSPEWQIWSQMIQRCSNPKNVGWSNYGARGISVCARWRESFAAFFDDMGPRPSGEHSIDRRDNVKNYEPGNCRWTTDLEQQRNRRNSVMTLELAREARAVKAAGKNLSAWARDKGVTRAAARDAAAGTTWKDVG